MDIGSDFRLVDGDFSLSPDGDAETVSGLECLIQEIKNEAMTYPGDLFYDLNYGYGLQDFIQKQGTDIERMELVQRISRKLKANDLIDSESVNVEAQTWTLESIKTFVSFKALDEEVKLQVGIGGNTVTVEVI